MAVFPKDWELPNLRMWLAKIDIDRSLEFSHLDQHLDRSTFYIRSEKVANKKYKIIRLVSAKNIELEEPKDEEEQGK